MTIQCRLQEAVDWIILKAIARLNQYSLSLLDFEESLADSHQIRYACGIGQFSILQRTCYTLLAGQLPSLPLALVALGCCGLAHWIFHAHPDKRIDSPVCSERQNLLVLPIPHILSSCCGRNF